MPLDGHRPLEVSSLYVRCQCSQAAAVVDCLNERPYLAAVDVARPLQPELVVLGLRRWSLEAPYSRAGQASERPRPVTHWTGPRCAGATVGSPLRSKPDTREVRQLLVPGSSQVHRSGRGVA